MEKIRVRLFCSEENTGLKTILDTNLLAEIFEFVEINPQIHVFYVRELYSVRVELTKLNKQDIAIIIGEKRVVVDLLSEFFCKPNQPSAFGVTRNDLNWPVSTARNICNAAVFVIARTEKDLETRTMFYQTLWPFIDEEAKKEIRREFSSIDVSADGKVHISLI